MPVSGVAVAIYGVDDLKLSTQFYEDFGLDLFSRTDKESVFRLEEGATVILRLADDPSLPAPHYQGNGVRETLFGIDSQEELEVYATRLAADREVRRMEDGSIRFISDCGIPLGLKVFQRKQVVYAPDPVNAADNIKRLNQHRRWRVRAKPKTINHIVWRVRDYEQSWAFFRDKLDFRLSDIQVDAGLFGRPPGVNQHHAVYFQRYDALGHPPHAPGFDHLCFGVEDVDEIFVGWNYMERRGWKNPLGGVGRHRIASAMFCYIDAPCGGNAEYGADTDYLDDSWVPRVWEASFGGFMWNSNVPPFIPQEVAWNVTFDTTNLPKGLVPEVRRAKELRAVEQNVKPTAG